MKLQLDGAKDIENPSDAEIVSALASMNRGDSLFAILGETELTYIQAFKDSKLGLVLEYQDGSLSEHFRSTDHRVALDRATYTFQKYANGDMSWRREVRWGKVPPRELSPPGPPGAKLQARDAQHGGDWVERLSSSQAGKIRVMSASGDVRKKQAVTATWEDLKVPLYYAVAVFAVLFFLWIQLDHTPERPVSSAPPEYAGANTPHDEAAGLIERCGTPTSDYDNQTEQPRPPFPLRTIDYQRHNLSLMFVPAGDTPVGSPPPYRWKLLSVFEMGTDKIVPLRDAYIRMPCVAGR